LWPYFYYTKKKNNMPEDNQKDTPQEQARPANDNTKQQEQTIHVHNPFTDKDVEVTQEQLDSVEKQIEAQTERD
jgi:hypothetical protein